MLRDLARERGVGVPGENFELVLDPVRHVLISSRRDHREIFQLSQITVGLGWAGRIRTFECQVQSLVPYQLGDRPAHLNSKAACAPASPNHVREKLKRRNAKIGAQPTIQY
jgi:hypothetical protein